MEPAIIATIVQMNPISPSTALTLAANLTRSVATSASATSRRYRSSLLAFI
jgi:hypothetical protein